MVSGAGLAHKLFERLFIKPQWQLSPALNDGTQPLYAVDQDARRVDLHFHAGQMAAWTSDKRFVFVIAGTQGGKTAFGPWWLAREIMRLGGGDYAAVTSTYGLFKLKFLPEMRKVFEHELGMARYWSQSRVLELKNPETGQFEAERADDPMWGRIVLRSAVARGGLESLTAKAALLDECGQDEFTLDAWEAVQRRLSLAQGRVLGTTTPYNLGWLKQRVYDRWVKNEADYIDVVQFASVINPEFPAAEFERVEGTMRRSKFRMMYRGEFDRPEGMIYEDFVDDLTEHGGHKILLEGVPPVTHQRIVGVDPGVINTAMVWLAHDPERDVWTLYRESLTDGRVPQVEAAAGALATAREHDERVRAWAVGAKSEKYHREDWVSAGARNVVTPRLTDVEAGIDCVIQLLKGGRLLISAGCTGTLDQIMSYRRVLDDNGEATEKIYDKSSYHYLDALRYAAQQIVKPRKRPKVAVETRRWA